jgi:hypothetical protein
MDGTNSICVGRPERVILDCKTGSRTESRKRLSVCDCFLLEVLEGFKAVGSGHL